MSGASNAMYDGIGRPFILVAALTALWSGTSCVPFMVKRKMNINLPRKH